MMVPIIVILAITSHIHCKDSNKDQLLYLQGGPSGPYVFTSVVSGRPEYKHTERDYEILFKDNQWVIFKSFLLS